MAAKSAEDSMDELKKSQDGSNKLPQTDAAEVSKPTQSEEGATNELSAEGGYTDREIESVDDDRFSFRDYARVLGHSIQQAGTPLTIGIFGRWGSGKSSLMNLLEKEMKANEDGKVKTLSINVWELGTQDEVWHAFLQALFSQVHRELSLWRRIDKVKLVMQVFSLLLRVVLIFSPIVLGLLFVGNSEADPDELASVIIVSGGTTVGLFLWMLARLKPIIEAVKEVATFDLQDVLKSGSYEAQITELMQLKKQFKEMVELSVDKDGRLVVFIDDLDRCTPDKVPDVLEAIKLFTTTPGCVYVLGLDHDIVRQGLKMKYSFKTETEAAEYLEKIVQIPFHLPPLDKTRVENFIQDFYPKLHQRYPTVSDIFSEGLEPNPRKIKRALNIYRTLLALAEGRVKAWEMDPVDDELVAKMVVIQSRFRELHEYLARHPTFLLKVEEKALLDGLDSTSLKDDEEVGLLLLGKAETKTSKAEPGLIDERNLGPLNDMLRIGKKYFNDDDECHQISTYIYLTSTAEGAATQVRPNRREREALLGGKLEKIRTQVAEILKRGGTDDQAQQSINQAYKDRLKSVLNDRERYTAEERDSAKIALILLEPPIPETVPIPAGPFLMGSNDDDVVALPWEKPQHTVELPEYLIGKYPVTNIEYQAFVLATGHQSPSDWNNDRYPEDEKNHPVVNVSWHDAVAYCKWLFEVTGRDYRLPTEAEWEKAARGTDGRIYPWGNQWDEMKLNSRGGSPSDMEPTVGIRLGAPNDVAPAVGQYSPDRDSPYGVVDMAGIVWNWTLSLWGKEPKEPDFKYPYNSEDGRENLEAGDEFSRVLRGGSWLSSGINSRCAFRFRNLPGYRNGIIGFRVGVSPI